jgi:exodeoxyribonuclease VII small subunit
MVDKQLDAAGEPTYGEALEELNRIVAAIEEDQFDLDELGGKVERAATLIRLCREKISSTEVQIQTIMEELDGDEE